MTLSDISVAIASLWSALPNFIFNYQTLIAGFVALLAAFITVRPVWRQLDKMNIQANSIFRDFLSDRIFRIARRQKWVIDRLTALDNDISRRVYEFTEFEDGAVNSHWAFDMEQTLQSSSREFQRFREEGPESAPVGTELERVMAGVRVLADTLEKIHRPDSTDQSGEDYEISDGDWAAVAESAKQAERELPEVAAAFSQTVKSLDAAFSKELKSLRRRLRETEELLVGSRG
jgi:hypothetical protein